MSETRLSFSWFRGIRTKAMRNGRWITLSLLEKALYTCTMELARLRGEITNARLVSLLENIARRLFAGTRSRISQVGRIRGQELLETYSKAGLFDWAPHVKSWFGTTGFIFHLGVMELFGR